MIALDLSDDQVNLEEFPLLRGEVCISIQLLLDSFCELPPVKPTDSLLEMFLIIAFLESSVQGTHIDFNQHVVLEGSRQSEVGVVGVLESREGANKRHESVQLLNLEPSQVTLDCIILLGKVIGLQQGLEGLLLECLLHLYLAKVEVELVIPFLTLLAYQAFNNWYPLREIGSTCKHICHDVSLLLVILSVSIQVLIVAEGCLVISELIKLHMIRI